MIKAEQLTRRYGDFLAVDRVDFTIDQGEIVGLLGHNGAGKTTIMKMLTGYLEPSSGRVLVDGVDVAEQPKVVQRSLGYLSESLPLYPEMTVVDYLEYAAELRGVAPNDQATAVREAIEATELEVKAFDAIHTLSRGYRQRVGVAQAILHKPRFLVLDEPTNGLDPSQTQHMRELIRRLAANATIVLSTHIMQEVNAVCDRAMILRNGRLVLDESLAELKRSERLLVGTDAEPETRCARRCAASTASARGTPVARTDGASRCRCPVTPKRPPRAWSTRWSRRTSASFRSRPSNAIWKPCFGKSATKEKPHELGQHQAHRRERDVAVLLVADRLPVSREFPRDHAVHIFLGRSVFCAQHRRRAADVRVVAAAAAVLVQRADDADVERRAPLRHAGIRVDRAGHDVVVRARQVLRMLDAARDRIAADAAAAVYRRLSRQSRLGSGARRLPRGAVARRRVHRDRPHDQRAQRQPDRQPDPVGARVRRVVSDRQSTR